MKYQFSFYSEHDYYEIKCMLIKSYGWEYPIFGLSRLEFSRGLHPAFKGISRAWEKTVGVFRDKGKIVGCAINEGATEGDAFFIFNSKENAENVALIEEMIFFAQTTMSEVEENRITRFLNLRISAWNKTLENIAKNHGFKKEKWTESVDIKFFSNNALDTDLPSGYRYADGNETPDFFLSNIHMMAFNYSLGKVKEAEQAFHELRTMKSYNPKLDICILDPMDRPVAMAIIWYDERMPYCELEPLGVVWWERRKHLATKLLNEAERRVKESYPNCTGMSGGDQVFYKKSGYKRMTESNIYKWKIDIYPSWDEKSEDQDYKQNM